MSTDSHDIPPGEASEVSADSTPRGSGGALALMLPPDSSVWNEARRLAADKSIRVEDLATCCVQDPVLVLDLLRTANAMFFSGGQAVHYSPDFASVGYNGASHGCVNIRDYAGIKKLFDTVRVGDKVIVYA